MPFRYDVALSFAGEDRAIAKQLNDAMTEKGIKVFYDEYNKSDLWGKKLTEHFKQIYGPKARFVIILISKHYPVKDWTNFEFSIARDEAKKRKQEFILPVRLDNTTIVGIHDDIGYLDYEKEGINGVVKNLITKLTMNKYQINTKIQEESMPIKVASSKRVPLPAKLSRTTFFSSSGQI